MTIKSRRHLVDLSDADCVYAFMLNHKVGEGVSMISGALGVAYGTADAAINRGRKLARKICDALGDYPDLAIVVGR